MPYRRLWQHLTYNGKRPLSRMSLSQAPPSPACRLARRGGAVSVATLRRQGAAPQDAGTERRSAK
ncbi:protein of unknown function (plasmid) [Rhodovastum atsumiense]|nr:protein of unknown function [Rhodovastum atsumiense]